MRALLVLTLAGCLVASGSAFGATSSTRSESQASTTIAKAKSAGALVSSLVGSIFATNVITADQYIAIVLPGRMFRQAFEERGFAPVVLSRAIGDSATPTSAIIPWNSCGAYMAATLGVATFSYLPFAIFSIVSPLVTIAVAFAGFRMMRRPVPAGTD